MDGTPRFDLVDIAKTLQRRSRYIFIITLAAAVVGFIFYLVQKKSYKATAEFFVANPLYTDRNNLFRTDRAQFIDYFGKEDDIDKVMAIANSELAKARILTNTHLASTYYFDDTHANEMTELSARFNKNFEARRTEYQTMEVSYTDHTPKVAARVANEAVRVIESIYGGYFITLRNQVKASLEVKLRETDTAINHMTDSLAAMRDQYKIYDIISPARQNVMSGTMRSGGPGFGRAIEEIQNIESIKDELVIDRAHYISLISEFSTGTKEDQLPLIQVISQAYSPNKPKGLGLALTTIVCGLVGFFFSCIWILLVAYFRALTSVER